MIRIPTTFTLKKTSSYLFSINGGIKGIQQEGVEAGRNKLFFSTTTALSKKKDERETSSSSSSSSDDDEKKKKLQMKNQKSKAAAVARTGEGETAAAREKKSEEAKKKLNNLLHQMMEESLPLPTSSSSSSSSPPSSSSSSSPSSSSSSSSPSSSSSSSSGVGTTANFARPKPKRDVRKEAGIKSIKKENVEDKVVSAVKEVATSFGGNVKQTESELLSKLLNLNLSKEGGENQNQQQQSNQEQQQLSLSDIIKDMKIEREDKSSSQYQQQTSRADEVKKILKHVREGKKYQHQQQGEGSITASLMTQQSSTNQRGFTRKYERNAKPKSPVKYEKVDIWSATPLGIFKLKPELKQTEEDFIYRNNKTWDDLYERDLKLATTHPPSNYFQEMIQWTEQGKIWKFPIDNEQDLNSEEKDVYFAEHIFLDKQLQGWCPSKGPVRHFMELVCVGLSKNPYMSIEKKKSHIEWYKNYFEDKQKILKEVGAIPIESKSTTTTTNTSTSTSTSKQQQ